MSFFPENDTVCAISTPWGKGGIAIVRISGDNAISVIKKIFTALPENFESHKLYYGFIKDNFTNKEIDEVLVSVMKSPRSYTKEDVVEINCHGGYLTAREIVNLLTKNSCRIAEPGEFTKRAFLNGRIDLTQAEAIIEVINAKTKTAVEISEKNLKGFFRNKVNELKEELLEIISTIESNLDFFEDTDFIQKDEIFNKLKKISDITGNIINSFETVKKYYQGINLVIAGPPNAGKSSLLNYLLKNDRAIVSSIPGTTRDTIEEDIFINDIPVKVIDTAGIRDTCDKVETEGVKRAIDKVNEADIVLYIFDRTVGLTETDKNFIDSIKDKELVIIGNKIDLLKSSEKEFKKISYLDFFPVSVAKNINMQELERFIGEKIKEEDSFSDNDIIITEYRQFNIFIQFKNFIDAAYNGILKNLPLDMVCFELNEAVKELEKITGEITTEDVLDKIFSKFCVGK